MCPINHWTKLQPAYQESIRQRNSYRDLPLIQFHGQKITFEGPVKTLEDDRTYKIKADDSINSIAERIYNSDPGFIKGGKKDQQIENIIQNLLHKNPFLCDVGRFPSGENIKSHELKNLLDTPPPAKKQESYQKENKLEKGSSKAHTKLDL